MPSIDTTTHIRPSTEYDLPVMVNLLALLGYPHTENSLLQNVNAIRARGGEIFVAENKQGVVGCISGILDVRLAEGLKGEIVSLVVDKSARCQGIGRCLVNAAEQWLLKTTPHIQLRANTLRRDAHRFYTSLEYAEVKTQKVFNKKCPSRSSMV